MCPFCRMNIPANTFQPRARPLFQYRHYRYFAVSFMYLYGITPYLLEHLYLFANVQIHVSTVFLNLNST
jgi:hypothetical protein